MISGALKEIAYVDPKGLHEKVDKSMKKFRNVEGCVKLMDYTQMLLEKGQEVHE